MAGTTSLLKSAASARKKVQAQQDAEVAFNWENSAQTYEDFVDYSKYLQDRQSSTTDPSQALTYAKALRSASRSYTSNEIQRTQMAIMEGNAGTQDKMDTVRELFFRAQDNGDLNLAQNLLSQWDTLSIKLQNEQQQAAKDFAASSSKAKDAFMKSLTDGVNDVTLPNGQKVTPLAAISDHFANTGDTVGSLKAAQDTLDALRSAVIDQYTNATTQEEVDKLEQKYGAGLQNIDKVLKVDIGGKTLSTQDVVNGLANDQMNNPKYGLQAVRNEATGQNEFKLKENNVEKLDYVRQIDPTTGQEFYVPATIRTGADKVYTGVNQQEGLGINTQITNNGEVISSDNVKKGQGQTNLGTGKAKRDESLSIGNRLRSLGIQVDQNGTTLQIKLPGENVARQATLQNDGSVRYYGDDGQLHEIGTVDRNLGTDTLPQQFKAGQDRVVSPTEISDFGTQSKFGGTLSQASEQGKRYINDITGNVTSPSTVVSGPIRTGNDFGGFGTALTAGGTQGTSAILQSAGATKAQLQLEQQKQQMLQAQNEAAQRLQASQTFNLNQTPVQQLAANGVLKRQLQVAAPAPTPRVVVAAPAPTPRITSVSVAQPTQNITGVTALPAQPRLVVR